MVCGSMRTSTRRRLASKEIHFPHQSGLATLGLAARLYRHADFAALRFQQSPFWRQLAGTDEACGTR